MFYKTLPLNNGCFYNSSTYFDPKSVVTKAFSVIFVQYHFCFFDTRYTLCTYHIKSLWNVAEGFGDGVLSAKIQIKKEKLFLGQINFPHNRSKHLAVFHNFFGKQTTVFTRKLFNVSWERKCHVRVFEMVKIFWVVKKTKELFFFSRKQTA